METLWTLHVENFGRIESADIEVSPLTLFVGDNNSGKSYLLALIYGLMCADDVLSDLCKDSSEYQTCAEWVYGNFFDEDAIIEEQDMMGTSKSFDDVAHNIFEGLLNRILQNNQGAILQSIFNADIFAEKISITFPRRKDETLRVQFQETTTSIYKGVLTIVFNNTATFFHLRDISPANLLSNVIENTLKSMITQGFSNQDKLENITFLPTIRTGLLLTYPALTKDAFSRAYNSNKNNTSDLSLIRPVTDFLGNLTTVDEKDISLVHDRIIQFVESNIIHGKILVSTDLPLPEFYYRPENTKTALPMFLSSDVIKEVAPLVLMLQYKDVNVLLIEEPEMGLHPKLQQVMARTLLKLVNEGIPVIAATHSDTILQHINNMVKLRNLPEARRQTLMERFGFDPDDPISADNISMYQFDVQDNGKTVVRALTHGDYGFGVPTFYDPLEKIMEQTQATEPDAEEYED